MKIKNKHAQHEIVGFVIIVVVVSVIALILLSFMIQQNPEEITDIEVRNLLDASIYHTTDCAINFIPQYLNIEELIKACYNNKKCLNKENSCKILKLALKEIFKKGLNIGSKNVNKGFEVNVYYSNLNTGSKDKLISQIKEGKIENCGVKVGATKSILVGFSSEVVDVELIVCKE